ncbi:uncharacterized protein [Haliotis asinina]|uniref:uncharacterized protein n=1 Tax=Haliotis asinina TaxID=109174 RepID=UPI003531C0B3
MTILRPALVLLLVGLMLTPEECEGYWSYHHSHHNINNCHCNTVITDIIKLLKEIPKHVRLGKREVSTLLDVDEDGPLLEEFVQNSMDKRKYVVETLTIQLDSAAQESARRNRNHCQCGRMVLEEATRSI